MKLRNKRTGEIKEWDFGNWYQRILNPDNKESYECTLSEFIDRTAEFREEWEDYEEPKEYWYIDIDGGIMLDNVEDDTVKVMREIGNYFETREEAEKAVEKLKAFKRLKDKGFRFRGWIREHKKGSADITIASFIDEDYDITNDLDICFGGEE